MIASDIRNRKIAKQLKNRREVANNLCQIYGYLNIMGSERDLDQSEKAQLAIAAKKVYAVISMLGHATDVAPPP